MSGFSGNNPLACSAFQPGCRRVVAGRGTFEADRFRHRFQPGSFPCPSLRRSGGFSLVEVAMALGIFAFAIIPIIGMMGTGLSVSKDSIESSMLSQIFRQTEACAATNTNNTGTLYFSSYGEQTNAGSAIYRMTFTNVTPADAAAGLLARRLLQATVVKVAAQNIAIPNGTRFLQMSKDPVDMRTNNFWND